MFQTEKNSPAFIAYHVRDGEDGKEGFWTRIGAAWKHKDSEGYTLQLDLVPVASGRISLRTPKAKPQEQAA
ncbi:hypothetical protein KF840_23460 [bacterium]|nr:hypothetical protein [bacterium]